MSIDPKLLELLRCPACAERPELREEGDELVCTVCARRYPVVNGIPRLVVEQPEE
ncbi:MAG TPA: Trm112 family protein [Armatimonadota bacterium]